MTDSPTQEMSEVPEYRQSKNAPSQNAIDEAYQKGILRGMSLSLDEAVEGFENDESAKTIMYRIDNLYAEYKNDHAINHHHGDE